MCSIDKILTQDFINWLNCLGFWGAFRFKITRLLYRIIPNYPITRNKKWDFILQYLPHLSYMYYIGRLKVLDIGCTDSLLIYEIAKRKYKTYGLDIKDYQEKLPKNIIFLKENIIDEKLRFLLCPFHYIVASSVIELIKEENGDRKAIENIYYLLRDDGYFIITLANNYWKSLTGRGYNLKSFNKLINGLFQIYEITSYGGYLCAVLVKI